MKILLIEDEIELSLLCKTHLEQAGYQVIQACDGERGLELARTLTPDLIILDLKLPLIDGYNICERLKNDQSRKHIPIIILSARDSEYERQLGLSLGAEAYLTKPYRPEVLLAKVKELVK